MTSQGDSSEPRFPYVWVHLESLNRNKSWGCDISSLKCFLRQNFLAILLFGLTSPTVLLIIVFCFFLETALMWPLNVFKPQDWRCFVDPVGHVLPASESRPRMHLKPVWAFVLVFFCMCMCVYVCSGMCLCMHMGARGSCLCFPSAAIAGISFTCEV